MIIHTSLLFFYYVNTLIVLIYVKFRLKLIYELRTNSNSPKLPNHDSSFIWKPTNIFELFLFSSQASKLIQALIALIWLIKILCSCYWTIWIPIQIRMSLFHVRIMIHIIHHPRVKSDLSSNQNRQHLSSKLTSLYIKGDWNIVITGNGNPKINKNNK
jgi:hypothetical protein